MSEQLIQVVQLPVIEQRLRELKEGVDKQVADAMNLVCTEETLGTVKNTRTELNKQFQELETQRKAVKKAVLGPYEAFEKVYKECVSDAFKLADVELKDKIGQVENDIKKRCEDMLRAYFQEVCTAEKVDFLQFEQLGIKIGMTEAKSKNASKLKDQIVVSVVGIAETIKMISGMENAEEIMVEYKKTLNAPASIATVKERHERMEAERKAREEREARLKAEEEAAKLVEETMAEIQEEEEELAPPETVEVEAPAPVEEAQEEVQEVETERIVKCSFTVRGTRRQMKALKEFIVEKGIEIV